MKEEKSLDKITTVANIMLAGAGSVCLLALFYFVYYYGWTGQRQFSSWVAGLVCYIVPALAATILFASLRLRPSHKINIALSLFSVGVAVIFLEIAASVWFRLPSVQQSEFRKIVARTAASFGSDFDARSEPEVIRDLRSQGIDANPSIWPQALLRKQDDNTLKSVINLNGVEVLPLTSISNRVTVACNETGDFLTYTSDEHGFNNPQNIWQSGAIEIVALGDSFVQGFCVPPEKNFVSEIRRRHPATLSLGTEGNGPLVMLASLKEYAAILKPKIVLWFYFESNDEFDLSVEKDSPLLRRYMTDGFRQGLMERQAEIDQALSDFIEPLVQQSDLSRKLDELSALARDFSLQPGDLINIMKLVELRTRLGLLSGAAGNSAETAPVGPLTGDQAKQQDLFIDLFNEILLDAKRSTEEWGGQLYFIYLPAWTTYGLGFGPNPNRDRVLETALAAGLPVIDIHRTFSAHKDPVGLFPFRLAHHYNEEGHRLVGQEVLQAISLDNEANGINGSEPNLEFGK